MGFLHHGPVLASMSVGGVEAVPEQLGALESIKIF